MLEKFNNYLSEGRMDKASVVLLSIAGILDIEYERTVSNVEEFLQLTASVSEKLIQIKENKLAQQTLKVVLEIIGK
jgi:hypothetical protein